MNVGKWYNEYYVYRYRSNITSMSVHYEVGNFYDIERKENKTRKGEKYLCNLDLMKINTIENVFYSK